MSEQRLRKTEPTRSFDRLPLNALRVFEAVATCQSFATAAEALHVTPAAVSMQIRTLEDYLRVPLFRRSGRRIALSAEGALLLPGVRRGLAGGTPDACFLNANTSLLARRGAAVRRGDDAAAERRRHRLRPRPHSQLAEQCTDMVIDGLR